MTAPPRAAAWPARWPVRGHVGEDEVLEPDVGDDPRGSRIGPVVRTSTVVCRSVWLARTTTWSLGIERSSRRGPVSSLCCDEELVDRAGELHLALGHHDQVVADPLDVGEQVRRQDDGRLRGPPSSSMTSARNVRRASGSRLATGSSSTSSSGRLPMARVSASCERWPPESFPARCARSSPSALIRSWAAASSQSGFVRAPRRR